ncbi:MAG: hypothetical protein KatS3mg106_037 [Gemmataceae bacterium]|nr:MAG: hypothetical protein KatS3mg106_037 [Gemmataceae bacterium]
MLIPRKMQGDWGHPNPTAGVFRTRSICWSERGHFTAPGRHFPRLIAAPPPFSPFAPFLLTHEYGPIYQSGGNLAGPE